MSVFKNLQTGEDLDTVFVLHKPKNDPHNLPVPFPGPISLRDALTHFADLTSSPPKSVLLALAAFASNEVSSRALTLRLLLLGGFARWSMCWTAVQYRLSLLQNKVQVLEIWHALGGVDGSDSNCPFS